MLITGRRLLSRRSTCMLPMLAFFFAGCQLSSSSVTTTAGGPLTDIQAAELHNALADLARAHQQKVTLAWWVSAPFVGKPVGPAIQPYYARMGERHAALLKEMQAWASEHHVNLAYEYPAGIGGQSQKIMEERQEKLVRADAQADFERDMLFQMYIDYELQISLISALLPHANDPSLKALLQKNLEAHEAGSAETMALLKRFKFTG